MKKQPVYFLAVLTMAAFAFASCGDNMGYRKTKSGLMYKIYSTSKDSTVKSGDILKYEYTVKLGKKDSVLGSSADAMPQYGPVQDVPDDAYTPAEIFKKLHKGDSAVVVCQIDTLVKKGAQLPPFLKKGDNLVYMFKIVDVFKSQADVEKDQKIEMDKARVKAEKQAAEDMVKADADMKEWLAKKNIQAQKIGKGVYVVVKEQGTGMQADSGKFLSVKYEGKTLRDEKVFQSTMDAGTPPYTFQLGAGNVIRGWDEGLKAFKAGGKGTLYIPGPLAYGRNPQPGSPFKPNDALIFDVAVTAVSDSMPRQQAMPQQQIPEQLREQMEKQRQKGAAGQPK